VERPGSVEKRHCRVDVRRGEADHAGLGRSPRVSAGGAKMRGANGADSANAAFTCDLYGQRDRLVADPAVAGAVRRAFRFGDPLTRPPRRTRS
jgi:hypothetical protein